MFWDDLVNTTNQTKAKARIYGNYHLDQRYPKGKWPLKIKDSGQDKQPTQPKNGVISQSQGHNKANVISSQSN